MRMWTPWWRLRALALSALLGLLALLGLHGLAHAAAAAPPAPSAASLQPVSHFTNKPLITGVEVSPSGRRVALLMPGPNGRVRLAVMGLSPRKDPQIVAAFSDADIQSVHWVNDDRLVFEAFQDGPEIRNDGAGTFAVDHDGGGFRQLIAWRHANSQTDTRVVSRVLPYGWFLHSTLDDAGADVFVVRRVADKVGDLSHLTLARLNTQTGELRNLSAEAPAGVQRWLIDPRGEPRMVVAVVEDRRRLYWRAPGTTAWQQVEEFQAYGETAGFEPSHFDADGSVVVRARRGRDTTALYAYDPVKRAVGEEPLVAVTGFDLDAGVERDPRTQRVLGFHFKTDRPMSYWLDPSLSRLQKGLDSAMPDRVNRIHCGRCESSRFVVVHSSSDRHPGEYLVLDRESSSMEPLGQARPWIDERLQGRRTFHRVPTADGLSMPVVVTHPAGSDPKKPLPAVVLVHGGPFVRGVDLQWDSEAQFLASRGYRVIEPEFRGSTGYGFRHFQAGWKEWGHGMQDDIAGAVRWAVDQKLVDGQRVCVMGASYGGYAALMGPIRHPQRYRCAVSFAGVSDIDAMYTITWSDLPEEFKRYGMPVLVGDREKDAARLKEASPLERVRELKVPVLLAHGSVDRRVPVAHATRFASAAKGAGVPLETVYYNDEGHGWFFPKNQEDFYQRVEQFLAKALGAKQP